MSRALPALAREYLPAASSTGLGIPATLVKAYHTFQTGEFLSVAMFAASSFRGPHGFPKMDVSIRSGRKMPSSAARPISSLSCGNIPNTKNRWGGRVAMPIPSAGSKFPQEKGKVGGGSRKGYRIIARATRGKANASSIPMNPAIKSRQGLPLVATALSQCAINFWLLHLVCQSSIIYIHQSWY